jgi:hypothetical protein
LARFFLAKRIATRPMKIAVRAPTVLATRVPATTRE